MTLAPYLPVKFALCDYSGQPRSFWIAQPVVLPPIDVVPTIGHHIVVLDASGSMWNDMGSLRSTVEKALAVQEYADAGLLVSVLSYASAGDLVVHASRLAVKDLLAPGSAGLEAIRSMTTRGLTCASQALEHATTLLREGETTCISLHSDGWFNDRSPTAEKRAIEAWMKAISPRKEVFVSTIAYRQGSDFPTLAGIANRLSGKCVQANTLKEVVDAINDTSALLAGRTVPARTIPVEGAGFVAAVNLTRRKVNGTTTDLVVRGDAPGDHVHAWRYRELTKAAFDAETAVDFATVMDDVGWRTAALPLMTWQRALVAEGRLNQAKFALVTTRDQDLIRAHACRPPAAAALANWAADLDRWIGTGGEGHRTSTVAGIIRSYGSLPTLVRLLNEHKGAITIDVPALLQGYVRRSEKRLEASRDEAKALHPAASRLVPRTGADHAALLKAEINTREATINLTLARRADLVDAAGRKIEMIAGVPLDLSQVRAYTIVADGEATVPRLPLRFATPHARHAFQVNKLLESTSFVPGATDFVPLAQLPGTDLKADVPVPVQLFPALVQLRTVLSILAAALPEGKGASTYTEEQRTAFSMLHLSTAGWFQPPTTTPFLDRDEAIRKGWLDSYVRYRVDLGSPSLISVGETYSANEYLARRYAVRVDDTTERPVNKDGTLEKPNFVDVLGGASVQEKTLSARTKLNAADELQFPVFAHVLGVPAAEQKNPDGVRPLSMVLGGDGVVGCPLLDSIHSLFAMTRGGADLESIKEKLAMIKVEIEGHLAMAWATWSPAVLQIGAAGLLPGNWTTSTAMDAEQATAACPSLSIPKKAKESGTFFLVNATPSEPVLVTVHAETAWYTTTAGVEEVKRIQAEIGADDAGEE